MSEASIISSNYGNYLRSLISKPITVDLKEAGIRLQGILKTYDQYSNIVLTNVKEYVKSPEGQMVEGQKYENILVRGDSITHIYQ